MIALQARLQQSLETHYAHWGVCGLRPIGGGMVIALGREL